MKRVIVIVILLFAAAGVSFAQTGTWSGKLDIQGMKLAVVLHLDP